MANVLTSDSTKEIHCLRYVGEFSSDWRVDKNVGVLVRIGRAPCRGRTDRVMMVVSQCVS